MLRQLNNNTLPWFCAGDFNEILSVDEKIGRALRGARQMEEFRRVVEDCKFHNILFIGPKHTWSRGKGHNMILERLDRGFATEEWIKLFPMTYEKHLTAIFSDHTPLLFNISNRSVQGSSKR